MNKTAEVFVDEFIVSFRYPKFAAYVVNHLMKRFGMTREEATIAWEDHRRRHGKQAN